MSRKRNRESLPPSSSNQPSTLKSPSTDVNTSATHTTPPTGITTRRSTQQPLQADKPSRSALKVSSTPPSKKLAASSTPITASLSSDNLAAAAPTSTNNMPTRRSERKSSEKEKGSSNETSSQLSGSSSNGGRKSGNKRNSASAIAAASNTPAGNIELLTRTTEESSDEIKAESIGDTVMTVVAIDEHPYSVGHCLTVRYRDQSERLARIVERIYHAEKHGWSYYVHYMDFNRRNDEWIDIPRIISPPSVANLLEQQYHGHQIKKAASSSTPTSNQNDKSDVDKTKPVTGSGALAAVSANAPRYSTIADLDHDEHEGFDEESLLEHERVTKVKNIQYVQLGKYIMECWYFSPFPKEYYPNGYIECLYFDEFSFRFFRTKEELKRYQMKFNLPSSYRHPPGNEIYRDDNVSMFEIDGAIEKIYCQNLCYFAKLFLDHKTLYWDVDPFLFYVLCIRDSRGFHPVGYFSKEKYSESGYNLACILSFPFVQRKGYGRFLMEFSYELSKKEEKVGSPEKPLSDLGALGYRSYWASTIVRLLRNYSGQTMISIMDITCATSILPEDVITTLELLGLLKTVPIAQSASAETTETIIYAPDDLLEDLMLKYPENKLKMDPDKLHWTPFYTVDPKKDKWSIVSMKLSASNNATNNNSTAVSAPAAATAPNTNSVDGSEPMIVE